MTRQIIATAYSPDARAPGDQPTNFAHAADPRAGRSRAGEIDEAAAGAAALESGRIVWPTMVLAGKLDQSLAAQSPDSGFAAEFRAVHGRVGDRSGQ